jgi:hypothetical protein
MVNSTGMKSEIKNLRQELADAYSFFHAAYESIGKCRKVLSDEELYLHVKNAHELYYQKAQEIHKNLKEIMGKTVHE